MTRYSSTLPAAQDRAPPRRPQCRPTRAEGSAPGFSEPPLDWCAGLTETVQAVCVKAAPGIPEELIPPGWEAEFIAEGRDLKEAVLWSPALAPPPSGAPSAPRRATVLTAVGPGRAFAPGQPAGLAQPTAPGRGAHADTLLPHPGDPIPLREPGEYLLDPNPAVTRAGLVEDLARDLVADAGTDIAKIDPRIAFLTMDRPVATPFARTLRVLHSAPWHERQFAKRLRDLGIGAADIRRRGLAGDVDQIRRRLKLQGTIRATIVITRVDNQPWGLICTDPAPES